MKVAIRVDASSQVASGHLMRCLTLAEELRDRRADVLFVCRAQPGNFIAPLADASYRIAALAPAAEVNQAVDAAQTADALDGFDPDWLVVDHYLLDEEWERPLRSRARRIFAIDDLANRRHECDILLDQNWFGPDGESRYDGLVPASSRRLLGPRYALVQPQLRLLRTTRPQPDGVIRRVLVFFGAVDGRDQTRTAVRALEHPSCSHLAVDVVIGYANPRAADIEAMVARRPGAVVHRHLPSLAGLMARADVMLGAGGTTTWERCCVGLPAIVVVTAENQRGATEALADRGVHCCLGDASAVGPHDWANAVRALLQAPERVRAYSAAAREVTDGHGASRVADVLTEPGSAGSHVA